MVSDLLGTSARRMLHALAEGETNPAALAALADQRLRATPDQLRDVFGACADLHPVYRRLVKLTLEELRVDGRPLAQLDQQMADLLGQHHDAVHRLAEVPGLGVDSAPAYHCGSRRGRGDVSFIEASRVVDGRLSWERGECRHELQSSLPQRQSTDAAGPQSGGECRREGQGHHLRPRVSPARPAPRARTSHWCHRPPALSSHLEDSSPRDAIRGTRAGRQRRGEGSTRCKMIRELRSLGYSVELLPARSISPA